MANEACTGFIVSKTADRESVVDNNLQRRGGPNRFLEPVRSGIAGEMITEVALIRDFDVSVFDFKKMKEYDGMTNLISSTVHSFLFE